MLDNMRRLHPRGVANRGICVDADGAMLGPDCVLVRRTLSGYRAIERSEALTLQKCVLVADGEEDWLFHQCQRITDALNKGQVARAQIYGLRIPISELDDQRLKRLAAAGLAKWSFNPDEPRIPKGEPRAGEWTTNGDGSEIAAPTTTTYLDTAANDGADDDGDGNDDSSDASPMPLELNAVTLDDASQINDPNGGAGEPAASGSPAMQYRFTEPEDGGSAPPPVGIAETIVAADAIVGSLLGPLSAAAMDGLVQLAAGMSGPTLFLGILFVPTNGGVVVQGSVAGAPGLSISYDRDTGTIQVWRDAGAGWSISLDMGHIGADGLFHDDRGVVIGRALPNGAIIDPDALPGYRSQPNTGAGTFVRPQALADTATQPKLCPEPGQDQPGAPLDNPYQQYVSGFINGRTLPPGLSVNLVNPVSGKLVHFDDCQLTTGIMVDAKGTGYAAILAQGSSSFVWGQIEQKMLTQAKTQVQAAQGRPIEWYFAESTVANYMRGFFAYKGIPITIVHLPVARWTP